MRILFADNHREFTATVTRMFLAEHEVVVVPTIAEARAAFAATYDVVLVDYDLDDGKGDALVSWIRDVAADQKLVAISSRDDGNERLRAAGADATCAKIDFAAIGWVLAELSP
jgi:DNA-binding response OmpR family regulator